jgi:hypothetical protein
MVENGSNGGSPANSARRPFVVGAIVGAVIAALVTAGVALLLTGDDDSGSASGTTTSSSTTAPSSTSASSSTTTTTPPTTTTRDPNLPPPSIPSFGINLQNCPEGAESTTVEVTYSARNAERIQFSIDDEVVDTTTELEGSADVGPVPCDGEQHTLTVTAVSGGLRATREASVAVSSNSAVTVQ